MHHITLLLMICCIAVISFVFVHVLTGHALISGVILVIGLSFKTFFGQKKGTKFTVCIF